MTASVRSIRRNIAKVRKINSGGGHYYELFDDATDTWARVDGVTAILSKGVPKEALAPWAAKVSAAYVVDHWDELVDLPPSERQTRVARAWRDDRDAAGHKGKKVHALAEALLADEEVEVPEELIGHVDSYLRFLADWAVAPELVEVMVVNRRWRYMGTLDLIARLRDGRRWLLDIKTGRSGIWGEAALQLAAYRWAESYVLDGEEHPMVPVDATAAVWVRADGYDLYPLDTGDATFKAFLYAQQVAHFVAAGKDAVVGEALY